MIYFEDSNCRLMARCMKINAILIVKISNDLKAAVVSILSEAEAEMESALVADEGLVDECFPANY